MSRWHARHKSPIASARSTPVAYPCESFFVCSSRYGLLPLHQIMQLPRALRGLPTRSFDLSTPLRLVLTEEGARSAPLQPLQYTRKHIP